MMQRSHDSATRKDENQVHEGWGNAKHYQLTPGRGRKAIQQLNIDLTSQEVLLLLPMLLVLVLLETVPPPFIILR